jgi:hypothetical protein
MAPLVAIMVVALSTDKVRTIAEHHQPAATGPNSVPSIAANLWKIVGELNSTHGDNKPGEGDLPKITEEIFQQDLQKLVDIAGKVVAIFLRLAPGSTEPKDKIYKEFAGLMRELNDVLNNVSSHLLQILLVEANSKNGPEFINFIAGIIQSLYDLYMNMVLG